MTKILCSTIWGEIYPGCSISLFRILQFIRTTSVVYEPRYLLSAVLVDTMRMECIQNWSQYWANMHASSTYTLIVTVYDAYLLRLKPIFYPSSLEVYRSYRLRQTSVLTRTRLIQASLVENVHKYLVLCSDGQKPDNAFFQRTDDKAKRYDE